MLKFNAQLLPDYSSKEFSKTIFILLCLSLLTLSFILWTKYDSTKEKLITSTTSSFKQRAIALENELDSIINHVKILQDIPIDSKLEYL